MVHHVVVQKGQVVIEGDGPAASAGGRVLVQLPVVREVVQDLVVVCLGLCAWPAAVAEDQLLLGLVAQSQVCHVEVDLLQQAASRLHRQPLPRLLAPPSFASSASRPPFAASPLAAAAVSLPRPRVCRRSPLGPGAPPGLRRSPQPADGGLNKIHHVVKLLRIGTRGVVWQTHRGESRLRCVVRSEVRTQTNQQHGNLLFSAYSE